MNTYHVLRDIHIYSVVASFVLFAFRGYLMMMESGLLKTKTLRILPHVVDTILLLSAIWLSVIIRQYPLVHHWLTVKVVLLVVYIGLGMVAIKRGRTKPIRITAFFTALAVFAYIVTVARAHHPLGPFQ